jgi:2-dehydro-3-deoxyphosphooctonate aldolase (KDO 8-P synthase)
VGHEAVVEKAKRTGNSNIMVCERGASFGYNNLVSDMRSARGDARHRLPGGVRCHAFGAVAGRAGRSSGGQREFVPVLARAAVAVGVAGVFMETHPDPSKALSDGPNAWPLGKMESCCDTLLELDAITKRAGFAESTL